MKELVSNAVLVILEVTEPNKAPDLRYITVGISDNRETDLSFSSSAIEFFRSGGNYPENTKFEVRQVVHFKSIDDYNAFLKSQLAEYLSNLENSK